MFVVSIGLFNYVIRLVCVKQKALSGLLFFCVELVTLIIEETVQCQGF